MSVRSALLAFVAIALLVGGGLLSQAVANERMPRDLGLTGLQRVELDLGEPGPSIGDVAVSDAVVTENGSSIGQGTSFSIIVRIDPAQQIEDRITSLGLTLGDGSTLLALGKTSGSEMDADAGMNDARVLPIVGGTGSLAGLKGQVTFSRAGMAEFLITVDIVD